MHPTQIINSNVSTFGCIVFYNIVLCILLLSCKRMLNAYISIGNGHKMAHFVESNHGLGASFSFSVQFNQLLQWPLWSCHCSIV